MPFRFIAKRDDEADVISDIVLNSQFADASLPFLAEELERRKYAHQRHVRGALESGWYLGEILILIKSRCLHGEFLALLEGYGWPPRSAQKYMALRRRFPILETALDSGSLQAALGGGAAPKESEGRDLEMYSNYLWGVLVAQCGMDRERAFDRFCAALEKLEI